jgi:hypothetical protein
VRPPGPLRKLVPLHPVFILRLIGRIYIERQVNLQIAGQRETVVSQYVAALVLEEPTDKKLDPPAFGADAVQEGTDRSEAL